MSDGMTEAWRAEQREKQLNSCEACQKVAEDNRRRKAEEKIKFFKESLEIPEVVQILMDLIGKCPNCGRKMNE